MTPSFADLLPAPDLTRPPLVLESVGVRFGGIVALEGIDFELRPHETVAVVGQNGAGKSTLLNAISGLVATTRGSRIVVRDRAIQRLPAWKRGRSGLGRAFQDPPLVDHMTCLDNLLVGARLDDRDARERATALLEVTGLARHSGTHAAHLPYGVRKLVDIARALMCVPSVLLLDEPASGLDESEQRTVAELLALIKDSRRLAVLMVEHHMDLVESTADRALVLDAGTVARVGTPQEVLS